MAQIVLGPSRAYPNVPTVGDDLATHTAALNAIIEALNIHERRIGGSVLDSFVRVSELESLGLASIDGNIVSDIPSDTDASASHNHDSLYLRLDGTNDPVTGFVNLDGGASVDGLAVTGAFDVTGATFTGLSSDDLSDVASIAMLDEAETVTGAWTFTGLTTIDETGQLLLDANATTSRGYISTRTVAGAGTKVFTRDASADSLTLGAAAFALNIAGSAVDIAAPLTATSYDGVLAANLLDKSAAETVSGQYTFSSPTLHAGGSAATPGIAFSAETNTGIYRGAAGRFDISVLGSQLFQLDGTNGLQIVGDISTAAGDVSGATIGGILEANLLDKTATETRSGSWTISGATYFSFAPRLNNNVRLNALNLAGTVNVNLAYLSTTDKVVLAHTGLETLIQGSAIELGGNTSVTGTVIATGAITATEFTDSTAAISSSAWNEAYGWGDHALAGYAAASHTHAASDVTSGVFSVLRLGDANHGHTQTYKYIGYNRVNSTDFDSYLTPGFYGMSSLNTNGPAGYTYGVLDVQANSDVGVQVMFPRNGNPDAIAYRGWSSSGAVINAWKYAGYTTTLADADLSLYAKSGSIVAGDIDAEASTDGYVLTSDGLGNAAWEAVAAGGTIGGTIANDQIAIGAATANEIEGSASLTFVGGVLITPTIRATTRLQTLEVRSDNAGQLVLNAGESSSYATGQTAEAVFINAESGLQVHSSPDNWASGWAGRDTAYINIAGGTSLLPGSLEVVGNLDLNIASPIIDYASGYLSIRTGAAGANGLRLYNSGGSIQGYLYSDGAATFGLLHSGGGWAMQIAPASTTVTFPGNVNVSAGVDVTGNLTVEGDPANIVRKADYNNTGYEHWEANNSAAVTANAWYTIATDPAALDITTTPVGKTGASRGSARFRVWDNDSGQHSFCEFEVSCMYGRRPTVTLINRSGYGSSNTGVRAIRVVRYSTYNGVAIQVQAGHTGTLYCSVSQRHTGGFVARDFLAQTPEATWYLEYVDFNNYGDMRFMAATGPSTGADGVLDGIGVGDKKFFPALDGGNVGTEMGYFSPVTNTYGSVNVAGCSGVGGTWAGYVIENEWNLMSYAGAGRVGIYDDVNNEWAMQWYANGAVVSYYNGATVTTTVTNGLRIHQNNDSATDYIEITHNGTDAYFTFASATRLYFQSASSLDMLGGMDIRIRDAGQLFLYDSTDTDYMQMYHNGTDFISFNFGGVWKVNGAATVAEFQTIANTATGQLSGLKIVDHANTNLRYAGFADSIESRTNTSFTMGAQDVGNVAHYTNGSTYNATLAASTDLDFPVGARMDIINRAAGTININQGTGTTLYWADGDGAMSSGNRDLGYGWCTIWRQSSTIYYVTGNGIT